MKSYSKNKAFALTKKGVALPIAAALLALIALFGMSACPNNVEGAVTGTANGGNTGGAGKSEPKHIVSFSVDGAGGTLKAKADGVTETGTSPVTVEQDKIVTFTAVPAAGYKLKEWKVDGTVISNTSNTYTHSVTTAVDVKVSFQLLPPGKIELTLSPDKLTIKVNATTADGTHVMVEGCTETELTSGWSSELHARGTTVILKGNIIKLSCANYGSNKSNKLTAVNVQGCTALEDLNCAENRLTTLNVQGLNALKYLGCSNNQLTALNVQGLTALQYLNCNDNRLTSLNAQGCTALKRLDCEKNRFTTLNVQGLSSLQELWCGWNHQLAAVNVQGLNALKDLFCQGNALTALNVQGLTALQKLDCYDNKLTELNVQGCTALKRLDCNRNKLTALNVQGLSALEVLECNNNKLTALNVQGLSALVALRCGENLLTTLDVQGLSALVILSCNGNKLTALNVQDCTALKQLGCSSNQLNADVFTKLFNDLPQHTANAGAKCYLFESVTEGNHKDFTSPGELKNAFDNAKTVKNWKMYKYAKNVKWVEI